jgi:membrane associated rhomboid family serine protease
MLSIFAFGFIFGTNDSKYCLIPIVMIDSNILRSLLQSYRFIVSAFFHSNVLHITMNILSFRVLGPPWERTVGSLSFLWQILIFDILGNFIHFIIALVLWFNPWFTFPSVTISCTIGFSGVLFTLLVIHIHHSTESITSTSRRVKFDAHFYPWVLLVVSQFVMPNVSFFGHLSGILVGYLYEFGWLQWLMLSPETVTKIESSRLWGKIVQSPGYIVHNNSNNFGLQSAATTSVLSSRDIASSIRHFFARRFGMPTSISTPPSRPSAFPGKGQTLGTATTPNDAEDSKLQQKMEAGELVHNSSPQTQPKI